MLIETEIHMASQTGTELIILYVVKVLWQRRITKPFLSNLITTWRGKESLAIAKYHFYFYFKLCRNYSCNTKAFITYCIREYKICLLMQDFKITSTCISIKVQIKFIWKWRVMWNTVPLYPNTIPYNPHYYWFKNI